VHVRPLGGCIYYAGVGFANDAGWDDADATLVDAKAVISENAVLPADARELVLFPDARVLFPDARVLFAGAVVLFAAPGAPPAPPHIWKLR